MRSSIRPLKNEQPPPGGADDTAAIELAGELLRDLLVQAFFRYGWPTRLTLPDATTPAEAVALDLFVAAVRLDLPGLRVVIR
jgi:hypothetical protein